MPASDLYGELRPRAFAIASRWSPGWPSISFARRGRGGSGTSVSGCRSRWSPAEQAQWGDYFVGGVWTTTNARGKKEEIRWEWILDKSFIRLTWKIGEESREEIHAAEAA
jgi:hypothetical protein